MAARASPAYLVAAGDNAYPLCSGTLIGRPTDCSYVKYDLCGQGNLQPFVTFQVMRDALNATGRPMLYSCEPQQLRGDPIEWPPYISNMFRIAADMGAYYGLFTGDALLSNAWVNVAEQGGWTDSRYLEVGNVPGMVNISMSRTQFALWCIVKTNLLIAADIRKMNSSDPYLDILLNKELIAISQVRTLTCTTYHRELLEEMDGIYARHVPP